MVFTTLTDREISSQYTSLTARTCTPPHLFGVFALRSGSHCATKWAPWPADAIGHSDDPRFQIDHVDLDVVVIKPECAASVLLADHALSVSSYE